MTDFHVSGPTESSLALHTITSVPLDPQFPLFQRYPALKLGVRAAVDFYVGLLLPRAREIIARESPGLEWVVTVPPLFALPAAANLLARGMLRQLAARPEGRACPQLVELRYRAPQASGADQALADYSRASVDERRMTRQQLYEGRGAVAVDAELFRGRAVLFVNDINVTGTQQHFMRRVLAAAEPASIHWLHVLQVDPRLGRANPQIEYALNHLNLASFEEFSALLVTTGIEPTTRCVMRLLDHDTARLEPMLRSMGVERARALLELAAEEGRWKGAGVEYQQRLSVLAGTHAAVAATQGSGGGAI